MKSPASVLLVSGPRAVGKTTLIRQSFRRLCARSLDVGVLIPSVPPDASAEFRNACGPETDGASENGPLLSPEIWLRRLGERLEVNPDFILAEIPADWEVSTVSIIARAEKEFSCWRRKPLLALVDPERGKTLLDAQLTGQKTAEIERLHRQLQEAERIILNKSDELWEQDRKELLRKFAILFPKRDRSFLDEVPSPTSTARFHSNDHRSLSAKKGIGLDSWLKDLMVVSD